WMNSMHVVTRHEGRDASTGVLPNTGEETGMLEGTADARGTDQATRGMDWPLTYGTMDPNTGLISWPEFAAGFGSRWAAALGCGQTVGLAVGDVDDLKAWIEDQHGKDPMLFGHVAGNALM